MAGFDGFEAHTYVSLTTYKKDGTTVAVPVWIVPDGGRLYVWAGDATFKVKRLRRDPRCTLAPCNASGSKILGPAVAGVGRVLPVADRPDIVEKLRARYGFAYHLIAFVNRFRSLGDHVLLEIAPA